MKTTNKRQTKDRQVEPGRGKQTNARNSRLQSQVRVLKADNKRFQRQVSVLKAEKRQLQEEASDLRE